ncbi:Zn-dependent oxidoreductase [Actinobacteria bacterium YIM 96077]|uniref:Zn-dependent oxidoreductase n=1 Tax=Phytoactinopolyspora halophila TaxID=1981511 RepID=A0A329R2S7_9ACTN|nr:zinc-binding dehydrogenase [Phytoactinopolyspora halophila]AYY12003.1 Zn-dependent oxidoreductase [Actinobacteria bacterium YIM 96077]RAW18965.1 Zn-dependent oxidoreductase [Phytoactinopolyspora halophila]
MFAIYAERFDADNPVAGLGSGQRPEPDVPDGWAVVDVRATSLNHHDVWSLRGVGLRSEQLPMILGTDASGVDQEGNEVVIHAVMSDPGWRGDETLDPGRSLLSERYPGTFAERVAVPKHNLVPKPSGLSFVEAACLPTAWLTAYRMLFTQAQVTPGQTVLVQGAGGGVATAAIRLASAAGARVWVTSRDPARAEQTLDLGAAQVFESGQRLPERVDAVIETVGAATWKHSLRAVRPGGTVVIAGATSGWTGETELNRVFFLQLRILGSTMGTRDELARLLAFCDRAGVRPVVDRTVPLAQASEGVAAMASGDVFGKVVFTV